MTDLQKISNRLRSLASEMIDLGCDMNCAAAACSDLAVRGVELTEGGMVVQSWAEVIGEEWRDNLGTENNTV